MGAGWRCFVVSITTLVLTAAPLWAQTSGPALIPTPPPSGASPELFHLPDNQPAAPPVTDSPLGGEPCAVCPCGPNFSFQADWLWRTRGSLTSDTRNFVNGPDAAGFENLPAPTGDSGYRFRGDVRLGNWIVEGIYTHYGDIDSSLNRNINGVAFNQAATAGNWAGENSLNGNTYFSQIVNAASMTTPVNTAGDQSGLGPSTAFPNDARPALMAFSHTDFYVTEANLKGANYLFPLFGRGVRFGAGYVNANLNNDSWVGLSGTFRASNASGTTVSLPNSVLTAATGGNVGLYAGGGGGFTDGVSNGGTGTPSQLLFTHSANTRNELNGGQLILDADLLESHGFDVDATLKAGVFDNFAQGSIVETFATTNNDLSAYGVQYSNTCHHLAFMGGVGVDVGYHFTDEISVRAGYDVLFLTNLALGPEQIIGVSNNWYHVQTNGTAVLQSISVGMEIAF